MFRNIIAVLLLDSLSHLNNYAWDLFGITFQLQISINLKYEMRYDGRRLQMESYDSGVSILLMEGRCLRSGVNLAAKGTFGVPLNCTFLKG